MRKKKYISFDLWGTLIKGNPNHALKRNELIYSILFPEVDRQLLNVELKKVKVFSDYSNESLGSQLSWKQSILLSILPYHEKVDKKVILDRFQEFEACYYEIALAKENLPFLFEDVEETLNKLVSLDYTLGISSNTSFTTGNILREILKKLNIEHLFSTFLFSDELNISKPNPLFLEEIFNKYSKSSIVHIGDNLFSDLLLCQKTGIDFIHFDETKNKFKDLLIWF